MKVELWYVYYDSNNPITSIKFEEGYTDDIGDYTFTDTSSWWEILHPFSELYNIFASIHVCVRVYPESTIQRKHILTPILIIALG